MYRKLEQVEPTKGDLFLLRFLDRGGSLEQAKVLFSRAIVRASVRRAGTCKGAAKQLRVHRNTITRYVKPIRA